MCLLVVIRRTGFVNGDDCFLNLGFWSETTLFFLLQWKHIPHFNQTLLWRSRDVATKYCHIAYRQSNMALKDQLSISLVFIYHFSPRFILFYFQFNIQPGETFPMFSPSARDNSARKEKELCRKPQDMIFFSGFIWEMSSQIIYHKYVINDKNPNLPQ
jgi:hypothetical protein